jgi:hypothetical protein
MTGATARPEPDAQAGPPAPSRLPPDVARIRVTRDDNDGLRASADFADVPAALAAVERHMRRPSVYSIMIIFDH